MTRRVRAISASTVSQPELRRILADYVALDRLRVWRRLLVARFGLLALVAVTVAIQFPALPPMWRWVPPTVFMVPPAWAWIAELTIEQRLSQRLDEFDRSSARKS